MLLPVETYQREVYIGWATHTKTGRDARRMVEYMFTSCTIKKVRRVDPMNVKRGWIVVFTKERAK
jgi:hypothetical protein